MSDLLENLLIAAVGVLVGLTAPIHIMVGRLKVPRSMVRDFDNAEEYELARIARMAAAGKSEEEVMSVMTPEMREDYLKFKQLKKEKLNVSKKSKSDKDRG